MAFAYSLKEAVARFYETRDKYQAAIFSGDIIDYGSRSSAPYEVRHPARTLSTGSTRSSPGIWQRILNGPNRRHEQPHKTVQRFAFGFTNFKNYRIRVLLYAGKPNFRVLVGVGGHAVCT